MTRCEACGLSVAPQTRFPFVQALRAEASARHRPCDLQIELAGLPVLQRRHSISVSFSCPLCDPICSSLPDSFVQFLCIINFHASPRLLDDLDRRLEWLMRVLRLRGCVDIHIIHHIHFRAVLILFILTSPDIRSSKSRHPTGSRSLVPQERRGQSCPAGCSTFDTDPSHGARRFRVCIFP